MVDVVVVVVVDVTVGSSAPDTLYGPEVPHRNVFRAYWPSSVVRRLGFELQTSGAVGERVNHSFYSGGWLRLANSCSHSFVAVWLYSLGVASV